MNPRYTTSGYLARKIFGRTIGVRKSHRFRTNTPDVKHAGRPRPLGLVVSISTKDSTWCVAETYRKIDPEKEKKRERNTERKSKNRTLKIWEQSAGATDPLQRGIRRCCPVPNRFRFFSVRNRPFGQWIGFHPWSSDGCSLRFYRDLSPRSPE